MWGQPQRRLCPQMWEVVPQCGSSHREGSVPRCGRLFLNVGAVTEKALSPDVGGCSSMWGQPQRRLCPQMWEVVPQCGGSHREGSVPRCGRLFHSVGAATQKALSPDVGGCSSMWGQSQRRLCPQVWEVVPQCGGSHREGSVPRCGRLFLNVGAAPEKALSPDVGGCSSMWGQPQRRLCPQMWEVVPQCGGSPREGSVPRCGRLFLNVGAATEKALSPGVGGCSSMWGQPQRRLCPQVWEVVPQCGGSPREGSVPRCGRLFLNVGAATEKALSPGVGGCSSMWGQPQRRLCPQVWEVVPQCGGSHREGSVPRCGRLFLNVGAATEKALSPGVGGCSSMWGQPQRRLCPQVWEVVPQCGGSHREGSVPRCGRLFLNVGAATEKALSPGVGCCPTMWGQPQRRLCPQVWEVVPQCGGSHREGSVPRCGRLFLNVGAATEKALSPGVGGCSSMWGQPQRRLCPQVWEVVPQCGGSHREGSVPRCGRLFLNVGAATEKALSPGVGGCSSMLGQPQRRLCPQVWEVVPQCGGSHREGSVPRCGRLSHNVGAATEKALSPDVGGCSSMWGQPQRRLCPQVWEVVPQCGGSHREGSVPRCGRLFLNVGQPQRRLCPQVWEVVPQCGGSHREGSVPQVCPGHGHIKQQLALGTKCPSRVVMHQHVLDIGRSFVMHCLVSQY